ncbi:MaoC family dehydratase [Mycobacterium sp. CVI_P3]|uniref:MaoC family dehydratase n=1 Tax=Mycobacterium pinniadriaticum TaxID=2994102 RepID=A0ABT3SA21_9MYCO|nr:MaoC family dehydratase [Mycobacterium pinniadriaticum]MCX2929983.1 MaoC family dehydratase [Mycobacterium pinniadriaticum]MCX2936368.1 MaoC family dehydratase [Mycobacterium pinniadriaticum]
MEIFAGLAEFETAAGRELGPTDWVEITQDRVDMFADATDDHQWIHTDPPRAADGPFGGTIAHGLLTLSLLPRFMEEQYRIEDVTTAINYGFNTIRFIAPVPVGARVRGRSRIADVAAVGEAVQATMVTTIEIDGVEKPAAVIESIVRYQA